MNRQSPTRFPVLTALALALVLLASWRVEAGRGQTPPGRAGWSGSAPDSGATRLTLDAEELTRRVTASLAAYFGLPLDAVDLEAGFEADLGADPVDVAEVVGRICAEHSVAPPQRSGLATPAQLIAHIRRERERGAVGVNASGQPESEFSVQSVFYATTRAVGDMSEADHYYGGERLDPGKALEYGACEVTIPVQAHRKGVLESPSFHRFEFTPDPRKHVVLRSVERMRPARFWEEISGGLAAGEGADSQDLFLFVHGFNVSFAKAARRTAQIAYDLEFGGAPVFFSWPSDGSLLGYISDREDAEWSVAYLVDFLLELRERSGAARIHLIAHSMGNQALIRALYRIALERGDDEQLFDNVILAAPDFDSRVFTEEIAPRVRGLAARWTLYASDKDTALNASRAISASRLGTPLALALGIDCIDATGVDVTPWSVPEFHAYYASKLKVIADLAAVLRGLEPSRRDLTRRERNGFPYWALLTK